MECTECFPHAVRPILAEAVVVGVNICCTDDAHMIGMCGIAQLVRNDRHSLPVVEGCVQRFCAAGRCIGILAEVEECVSVVLVEVNEYTTLPRTVNAVAVTALHAVRDAKIVGVPAVADKCPPTAIRAQCRAPPREQQDESPLSRALHPRHLRHLFPHAIPLTTTTIHRAEHLDGHLGTRACLRCTPTTAWCLTKSAQGLPAPKSARTDTHVTRGTVCACFASSPSPACGRTCSK